MTDRLKSGLDFEAFLADANADGRMMGSASLNWPDDPEKELDLTVSESIHAISLNTAARRDAIDLLIKRRRELQNKRQYQKAQKPEEIQKYITVLNNIFCYSRRSILLEKIATFCLFSMNDACEIQPQYPVGDDNEPTFTAPANTPDVKCFYDSFNAICEVTMLTHRDQWYHEGQPVMRHLRDFENQFPDKPAYCLFVAPKIHRDTVNTFWMAVKHGYEGYQQRIVPLTIGQLSEVMEILRGHRLAQMHLTNIQIRELFDGVVALSESTNDSNIWLNSIPEVIRIWRRNLFQ